MKKLTKEFIGCLAYLGVAFFISLIYLLAAITGHLETTEETMNITASIVVVACFMLIPPITILIVLICKHKVYYLVKAEERQKTNETDTVFEEQPKETEEVLGKELVLSEDYETHKEQILNNMQPNYSQTEEDYSELYWQNEIEKLREKEEKEQNSFKYFEENNSILVKKYAQSVNNFIEKMVDDVGNVFLSMFKDSVIPLSSILVYPYRNSNSKLLLDKIKRDGLEFTFSDNDGLNNKIQKLTDFFITGLKKRIKDNDEWQDDFTFPVLLYLIVRNNVIKFYHDEYSKYFGYENLEEFCKQIPNGISDAENIVPIISDLNIFSKKLASNAKMYYVYYYIYETDINLPFIDTFTTICEKINTIYEELKAQKLENDLFGSPRGKSVQIEQTTDNITPTTIERVDAMSGAEFELFMTQYFKNQGFKTTHTPISGDYGIDLIIENDFGKIGVQAKCYSNKVSLDAVQQVVAGLRHYGLSSGIVITNNYFQPSAIRLAADNNITLWDRDKLIEKLGQ